MSNEELKERVIAEWDVWARAHLDPAKTPTGNHAFGFFSHLRANRHDLLEIGTDGACYGIIYRWLCESDRLED